MPFVQFMIQHFDFYYLLDLKYTYYMHIPFTHMHTYTNTHTNGQTNKQKCHFHHFELLYTNLNSVTIIFLLYNLDSLDSNREKSVILPHNKCAVDVLDRV